MKNFQPHLDILPSAQRRLWAEPSQVPAEFTLYGGTAIALQLGHRQSVDFAFFGNREFDTHKLMEAITFLSKARVEQNERNTLTAILTRGGSVTVSFFGVPRLPRLLPPPRGHEDTVKLSTRRLP